MFSRFSEKLIGRKFGPVRVVSNDEYEELLRFKEKDLERSAKHANIVAEFESLRVRTHELTDELATCRLHRDEKEKMRGVIDVFVGDPAPVDTTKRRAYVAMVAGLHKDVLEPKLRQMISRTLHLLEDTSNDRDFDLSVKGTVYALREIIRWGDAMVNEQVSYQAKTEE